MSHASAIYTGKVRHRRFAPVDHEFQYRLFLAYLDLDEIESALSFPFVYGVEKSAVASFYRRDHYGDPKRPLKHEIHELVRREIGVSLDGPVRLLTQLRTFGYLFNPVSFYYCFDAEEDLRAIIAEVSNTPWNERHCYVMDFSRQREFRFRKAFHVSPFMEMEHEYRWRFTPPGKRLGMHMENLHDGRKKFDATMNLEQRPLTKQTLAGALAGFPFMTGKVIGAIYWQALKLWLKGTPFIPHPKTTQSNESAESLTVNSPRTNE